MGYERLEAIVWDFCGKYEADIPEKSSEDGNFSWMATVKPDEGDKVSVSLNSTQNNWNLISGKSDRKAKSAQKVPKSVFKSHKKFKEFPKQEKVENILHACLQHKTCPFFKIDPE